MSLAKLMESDASPPISPQPGMRRETSRTVRAGGPRPRASGSSRSRCSRSRGPEDRPARSRPGSRGGALVPALVRVPVRGLPRGPPGRPDSARCRPRPRSRAWPWCAGGRSSQRSRHGGGRLAGLRGGRVGAEEPIGPGGGGLAGLDAGRRARNGAADRGLPGGGALAGLDVGCTGAAERRLPGGGALARLDVGRRARNSAAEGRLSGAGALARLDVGRRARAREQRRRRGGALARLDDRRAGRDQARRAAAERRCMCGSCVARCAQAAVLRADKRATGVPDRESTESLGTAPSGDPGVRRFGCVVLEQAPKDLAHAAPLARGPCRHPIPECDRDAHGDLRRASAGTFVKEGSPPARAPRGQVEPLLCLVGESIEVLVRETPAAPGCHRHRITCS